MYEGPGWERFDFSLGNQEAFVYHGAPQTAFDRLASFGEIEEGGEWRGLIAWSGP